MLDDFANVFGRKKLVAGIALRPGFLRRDGHAFFDGRGVMGADFASHAVFERSDDLSAGGIVFGIRGENEQDIERQTNGVALNLDVAFLHDIEKPHLNLSGQIRQLVDRKNAAVRARQQPVVHGQLVRKIASSPRGLDGINVSDNVGDGHIGRGQFLHETVFPLEPGDWGAVALLGNHFAAEAADGVQRVVMNFAAGDIGNFRFQEID